MTADVSSPGHTVTQVTTTDPADAATAMTRMAAVIDAHDWYGLADLLHEDFTVRFVHTGETFDRDAWVQLNADYPGFERLTLEDCVGSGDRAVGRCHVTGRVDGEAQEFEVASFVTVKDGLIVELTEVWADVDATPPPGTRPTA
ncbi:hypothetical protein VV01_18275 [Luteipulveratus halotolerans]|uniref:SnoaL-like domain-containing protein n=1 Tax=Luteipulveratus halotolerans TaxID=1631356 RepID=A0A0L6CM92_9MICO|nr:hypothetical protein VV01_18275 [Luteipulveratus halotolerans]